MTVDGFSLTEVSLGYGFVGAQFIELIRQKQYQHVAMFGSHTLKNVHTSYKHPDAWPEAEVLSQHISYVREAPHQVDIILHHKDMLVYVHNYGTTISISVAGKDEHDCAELLLDYQKLCVAITDNDEDSVIVDFWYQTPRGPTNSGRKIETTTWADISENYAEPTTEAVTKIMGLQSPRGAGRLILWHGVPGSGKTTAIRALMKAWQGWCNPLYISDPERFFADPSYIHSVLLGDDGEDDPFATTPTDEVDSNKWKLLVMEDADEFISADAKATQGQSLSRLLNTADGLLGQGLRVILLITTNSPLTKMHPAIIRPGRCLANVEFLKLPQAQAQLWLKSHDYNEAHHGEATLAELYEKLSQHQINSQAEPKDLGLYL